jgi:hypothetical protein
MGHCVRATRGLTHLERVRTVVFFLARIIRDLAPQGSKSTDHLWARRQRKSEATTDFAVERVTRIELA